MHHRATHVHSFEAKLRVVRVHETESLKYG